MYRRGVDEIALGREVFDRACGVLAGGDDQGRVAAAPGQLVGYSAYTRTHAELMAKRGVYATYVDLQSRGGG